MATKHLEILKNVLKEIDKGGTVANNTIQLSQEIFNNGQCQLLSQSLNIYEYAVDGQHDNFMVSLSFDEVCERVQSTCTCKEKNWCEHRIASVLQTGEIIKSFDNQPHLENQHKKYTREGMIMRVLSEREQNAAKSEYKITLNTNKFGEHILFSESGEKYKITFRNFNDETGYCSCPDHHTNKLGTCKHLMWAFTYFKKFKKNQADQNKSFPFVEVFCNPINNNAITYFYPDNIENFSSEANKLIIKYFGKSNFITNPILFTGFLAEAEPLKQILIRPEVSAKVEKAHNKALLNELRQYVPYDLSPINATLYDYQKKGIDFGVYRDGVIIADEMGLGKTIQAISIALMKKQVFDFRRVLIVCPASLKFQWKNEIEKFCGETSIIVDSFPKEREKIYLYDDSFFVIVNYETIMRDHNLINKRPFDLIILDEAQRIKNYNTLTAKAIKSLKKKHSLIITGTPIENKLLDLYSIVQFIDPEFLAPQWEFSYQHCLFDHKNLNQINGYYNLNSLKERLSEIMIRREKREVLNELPNITYHEIPVNLTDEQAEMHASFAHGIWVILNKKYRTAFDMQHLLILLNQMRMVCDSTFLIDKETNVSPKLLELENILIEKLEIQNTKKKVIIFSEWTQMLHLIGKMLRKHNVVFTELNGSVPVANRKKVIKEFEDNHDCCVFLSSEAGGSGLNLQVADTLVNFELPWNPAKKNQRIGRIDRIGQKSNNITIIDFITRDSIEMKIAGGLSLKQNLFDGVIKENSNIDSVDFSAKGRAQFIEELRNAFKEFIIDDIALVAQPEDFQEDDGQTEDKLFEEDFPEDSVYISEYNQDTEEIENSEIYIEKSIEIEEVTDILSADIQDNSEEIRTMVETGSSTEKDKKEEAEKSQIITQENQHDNQHTDNKEIIEKQEKAPEIINDTKPVQQTSPTSPMEVETVMTQGIGFLAGLFKMATGKDLGVSENSVQVNKETGEVTFKFKIPGM